MSVRLGVSESGRSSNRQGAGSPLQTRSLRGKSRKGRRVGCFDFEWPSAITRQLGIRCIDCPEPPGVEGGLDPSDNLHRVCV